MDYDAYSQQVESALAAFCDRTPLQPVDDPEVQAIQEVAGALLFEAGLTVQRVLDVAGILDHNAQTRFRALTGETLWQHITRMRSDAAAHLLEATDAPAYLVGRAVGYSGPETFGRAFKKQRGLPPIQYRRAVRRRRAGTV